MARRDRVVPVPLLITAGVVVVTGAVLAVVGVRAAADREAELAATTDGSGVAVSVIDADTRMGEVALEVADLETMTSFYRDALSLELLDETDELSLLGLGGEPVVRLELAPEGTARASSSDAGLYHTAILYPDVTSLANTLQTFASIAPSNYQGAADHAVSLAFYLADPEGNGVELYVDRPASEWEWDAGRVTMGSAALDPNAFIAEYADGTAPASATVGHVHLKVGDLDEARAFYSDTLGFSVTSEVDGAIFFSAGGYHHHLAANTWQSDGAGARGATTGLGDVTILVPDADEIAAITERLRAAGLEAETLENGLRVLDPWGTTVTVLAEA